MSARWILWSGSCAGQKRIATWKESAPNWRRQAFAAETKVLDGDAAARLAFARENQVELIIISSHGQSGLSGWNVGGVAQKVMAHTHVSLIMVRAL